MASRAATRSQERRQKQMIRWQARHAGGQAREGLTWQASSLLADKYMPGAMQPKPIHTTFVWVKTHLPRPATCLHRNCIGTRALKRNQQAKASDGHIQHSLQISNT